MLLILIDKTKSFRTFPEAKGFASAPRIFPWRNRFPAGSPDGSKSSKVTGIAESVTIGMEIDAETPAEIAVSIAGQIIQVRAQRRQ